jgi:hypothetical protein
MPVELALDFAGLALYDIVIYADDSGSMAFEVGGRGRTRGRAAGCPRERARVCSHCWRAGGVGLCAAARAKEPPPRTAPRRRRAASASRTSSSS